MHSSFASAKSTVIMGFKSTTKGGYINLNSSIADNTYEYRARELNPDGTPKKDAQGNLIYKSGSYESALAAALAENGVITAVMVMQLSIKQKTEVLFL